MSLVSCRLFFAELFDFGRDVYGRFGLHVAQFFDLVFEFGDGLFKVQKIPFTHTVLLSGSARIVKNCFGNMAGSCIKPVLPSGGMCALVLIGYGQGVKRAP